MGSYIPQWPDCLPNNPIGLYDSPWAMVSSPLQSPDIAEPGTMDEFPSGSFGDLVPDRGTLIGSKLTDEDILSQVSLQSSDLLCFSTASRSSLPILFWGEDAVLPELNAAPSLPLTAAAVTTATAVTAALESASPPPKRRVRPPKRTSKTQGEGKNPKTKRPYQSEAAKNSDDGWDGKEQGILGLRSDEPGIEDKSYSAKEPNKYGTRRTQVREKNRIAASKCRNRQRRATIQLTTKYEETAAINRDLWDTATDLQAEIYLLKNMLMKHNGCGCELIQRYFKDVAAHIANPNSGTVLSIVTAGPRE